MLRSLVLLLSGMRLLPHILVLLTAPTRSAMLEDVRRWTRILRNRTPPNVAGSVLAFVDVMTFFPEFRNLFYYRARKMHPLLPHVLACGCRPMATLRLGADEIGPGLFIQHGFSTIIAARRIGRDCWINQQVTIGYRDRSGCPALGDRVQVGAGAKILGAVTVGDGAKIGANAVVVHDVPAHCTAVGVPARILRRRTGAVDPGSGAQNTQSE